MKAIVTLIDDENFNPPYKIATYKVEPNRVEEDDISETFYFHFRYGRLKSMTKELKDLHKTPTEDDCMKCVYNYYDDPGECYECKSGIRNNFKYRGDDVCNMFT